MNGGHEHGNIVDSVAQVTSGHVVVVVVVSIGQSVTFSVVQGGHTVVASVVQGGHTVVGSVAQGGHNVVNSVVHITASVVPAGRTVFLIPCLLSLFIRLQFKLF
jgi:hypothetical protein